MSVCDTVVDTVTDYCKDAGYEVQKCTDWAANTIVNCTNWADEGSNQCTSWSKCHWYTPWDCIAGFFCRAWYWVADWVCVAVAIVIAYVCLAFTWVWVNIVCPAVWYVLDTICRAWEWLWCSLLAIGKALGSLFGVNDPGIARYDHVFVLMLENRAFDHMFGFSGITGVDPKGNLTTFNDGFNTGLSNIDPVTNISVAVSEPADFNLAKIPNADGTKGDADPGHELPDTVVQLCGEGAVYPDPNTHGYPSINNSGFIASYSENQAKAPDRIMKCFSPAQLPVLNQLAQEFAICDQWFSSMPGPTWPNRLFVMAATSGGLDNSPSTIDSLLEATINGFEFQHGNFFDLLDSNCIPWAVYSGDDFPFCTLLQGMNQNRLRGKVKLFGNFAPDVANPNFSDNFTFIEPRYSQNTFDPDGPGNFECGDSMHPLDDVTRGEALVKSVYEAVRNSPVWDRSVLIITFDEHGGFYDHVAPGPAVPPGDTETTGYSEFGFKFDRLGVRVPAIVISAHTPKGVIDHTVYDHTSILATVERMYGMGNLTNRDKAANDFQNLLSLETARTDAPTTLNSPATPNFPLACDGDRKVSEDDLALSVEELRSAKRTGRYKDRATKHYRIPKNQFGFLAIALARVLETAEYPDKQAWIDEFKNIKDGVDASLFMAEARLKVNYGVDVKKNARKAAVALRNRNRVLRHLNLP